MTDKMTLDQFTYNLMALVSDFKIDWAIASSEDPEAFPIDVEMNFVDWYEQFEMMCEQL